MSAISLSQDHMPTVCGVCGVKFTVPSFLYEVRSNNGQAIYCPNGHNLTIPAPDAVVRLREELGLMTRQKDRAVEVRQSLEAEVAKLYRRITSLKGSNTTLKRKLAKSCKPKDT